MLESKRPKGSPPKKSDKRENTYSKLLGEVAEGRGDVDEDVDE